MEQEKEPGTEILWAPTDTFVDRGESGPRRGGCAAADVAFRAGGACPVDSVDGLHTIVPISLGTNGC
jgi:hypothetical protein